MWILKIIFDLLLGKCLYTKKKKKMRVINYHQSLKLPTGAIKLRVNLPGFPWINQELSQGQAGLGGAGIGRVPPPPRGMGHNSAATNKGALPGLPAPLSGSPVHRKHDPIPHQPSVSAYHALILHFQRTKTRGCVLQSRVFFGPDLIVNVCSSFFPRLGGILWWASGSSF